MTWGLITPKFRLLCVPLTEALNCMFGLLLLSAVTPLIGICTGPAVVSVKVVELFAANTADAIPAIVAKFSVTVAEFGGTSVRVALTVWSLRIVSGNESQGTTELVWT